MDTTLSEGPKMTSCMARMCYWADRPVILPLSLGKSSKDWVAAQHINTSFSSSIRQIAWGFCLFNNLLRKTKPFQVLGDNSENGQQRQFFYLQVFKNPSCYLQASVNIFCFIFSYTKNAEQINEILVRKASFSPTSCFEAGLSPTVDEVSCGFV